MFQHFITVQHLMHRNDQPIISLHLLTSSVTMASLLFTYLPIQSTTAAVHRMEICVKQKYDNPQKLAMAFGSDFLSLALLSDMFVDKTLLIKRLLEDPSQLISITYPPKWGKSVNINMLKNFLEIHVHKNGTKISPIQDTFGYKLFKHGETGIPGYSYTEKLYIPPLIAEHNDVVRQYLARYPVIFLDFEHFFEKFYSYVNILDEIRTAVSRAFLEHDYMIEAFAGIIRKNSTSKTRRAAVQEQLNKFIDIANKSVSEVEIINSLCFLSGILHSHFRKRVFVLIDGYDSVFNKTLHIVSGFPGYTLKDKILDIYARLIRTTFINNKHIEKGILTGIFQINRNVLNLSSIQEYNVLNHGLHLYYGFTDKEANKLFNKIFVPNEYRDEAFNWFKYQWIPNIGTYNPWAIAHIIRDTRVRNYWMKAVKTNFTVYEILKYEPFSKICHDILKSGKNHSFEHNHLQFDKTMFEEMQLDIQNQKNNPQTIDSILSYFVAMGFFVITPGTYNETEPRSFLRYANEEVRAELALDMLLREAEKYNIPVSYMDGVANADLQK